MVTVGGLKMEKIFIILSLIIMAGCSEEKKENPDLYCIDGNIQELIGQDLVLYEECEFGCDFDSVTCNPECEIMEHQCNGKFMQVCTYLGEFVDQAECLHECVFIDGEYTCR